MGALLFATVPVDAIVWDPGNFIISIFGLIDGKYFIDKICNYNVP